MIIAGSAAVAAVLVLFGLLYVHFGLSAGRHAGCGADAVNVWQLYDRMNVDECRVGSRPPRSRFRPRHAGAPNGIGGLIRTGLARIGGRPRIRRFSGSAAA